MTTLTQLAHALSPSGAQQRGEATLTALEYDSRAVVPGALFVAVVGERFDAHDFLPDVAARGAAAVVVERADAVPAGLPYLLVENCRTALAPLACAFWDNPTQKLCLAGITGTNGKTSTMRLIDAIVRASGEVTGSIGTLGATVGDVALPHDRTTPESADLQRLFAQMLAAGARSAAMEVASHALIMGRTAGCVFDVAVFTNLTQDHLDFHKTMEAYEAAKALLFTEYQPRVAVLNADDAAGARYAKSTTARQTLTYSPSGKMPADMIPEDIQLAVDSLKFTTKTPIGDVRVRLGFGGTFQIGNVLAAIGYGIARGFSPETIAAGLAACPPVPGRFHPVQAGQDFAVLVDYAHTPDGVENVLKAARPLTPGRLITVFGCGGDRDKTKRPLMGQLAKTLSDIAIATSDNPRTEDPEKILDDILAPPLSGAGGETGGNRVFREADRRKAIALAVSMAQKGDTIVIAGKGHEDYQIIGREKFPFSDQDVAREEIEKCLSH
ncbi:UDP-N-acetylmuramoyl-L-alanyl-D-glutamate--2,6-diaminopimelate ligase [Armatimonas sp.]|uniref:UDP-N-acetylmuramoyl-L-alanyl-D-glutamate--2, 6-diaminopimelate ligase n=1 Tax=Armatimonas sp. TaxID=1872638 RepID=UPI00374CD649